MIAPWRLLAAAGALAVAAAGPIVAASPAAADTTLEVTTPADGHYLGGGMPIPLLVSIKADGAVKGTLVATFDGTFAGAQPVEVPGGSSKQVLFVVTPPPWSTSGQISFDGGSGDSASARLNLQSAGSDEMVGVLPSLTEGRDLPATAQLDVDLGVARLYPFDPALLDAGGPDALGAFSQVLATPDDLAALPDSQLNALRAWVGTTGGTLVVDATPDAAIPLEAEPVPGATDGSATFGVGQVRFSDGRASTSAYDGIFGPTVPRDTAEFPFGANAFGLAPTTILLASDAGVRIPAIGTLVGLLVVYGLVAGPVLWLVLRRTRRETFLWLALPALAVVATGAVYGLGRAMRNDTSTAHATIVADLPATRVITTEVLVTAPGGGRAGVELGEGWRPVQSVSDEQFFGPAPFGGIGGGGSTRQQSLDGNNLMTDLPAGGVGVVSAETAQPAAEPSWSFDLHTTDNGLAGTITNLSDSELENIMVVSGQGFDQVGSLGPGESAEVTLNGANRPVLTSDRMAEQLMNGDPFTPNDKAANPGLLGNWLSRRPMLRSPGFVTAVGWTRDQPGPLHTARGATVDKGRTAFLTTARVDTSGLDAANGRIELVRGTSTRVADRSGANDCTDLTVTARLTAAAAVAQPVLDVSTRSVAALDIWTGGGWLPAGLDGVAGGPDVALALPDGANDDGTVYLRLQMTCDVWGIADPFPSLRSADASDEVVPIDADGVVQAALGTGGSTTTGPPAAVPRPVPLPVVTVAPTTTALGVGND
ncbi:MAG: hypothetical protein R2761_28645 [Acidimicrobiales bacterium]